MTPAVPPAAGMLLLLAEKDYRFGIGPLLCRVREVLGPLRFDEGPPWWHLRADCANGTLAHHGGWHDRELYVISTAIQPVRLREPRTPP